METEKDGLTADQGKKALFRNVVEVVEHLHKAGYKVSLFIDIFRMGAIQSAHFQKKVEKNFTLKSWHYPTLV